MRKCLVETKCWFCQISLPVAQEVVPLPELLNHIQELEEQYNNCISLPNVTPMDVNEERTRLADASAGL